MKTSDFEYELPQNCIAQEPAEPRDSSRLMVLNRSNNTLEHRIFNQLGEYFHPGDVLVLNQTRVIPARVMAHKLSGGKVELLLLRKEDGVTWETLVGGKKVDAGTRLRIGEELFATIVDNLGSSRRRIVFDEPVESFLTNAGQMPLPPYIHTKLRNPERYQTV